MKSAETPCIALVLGGGGARGMAHVGVLEVLEQADIPVNRIVGCSAGSLVGALYADQPCALHVRDQLMHLKRRDFIEFDWKSARYGLANGALLRKRVEQSMQARNFEDLQIPLRVVATDLESAELVFFDSGPIGIAVQASCSIPFAFKPVEWQGRILVDGSVVDPTPVELAKSWQATLIIAVDLTQLLPKSSPKTLFGVAKRCAEIHYMQASLRRAAEADVIIRPLLDDVGTFQDKETRRIYEAGRHAALQALPRIQYLLSSATSHNQVYLNSGV